MSVTVRVPAKVNVHLGVGALRPDGYHDLTTVFQAVSLYDDVTVRPARDLSVVVRGEGADVLPVDDENLAARAVRALAERVGEEPAVAVELDKAIPVAGGMAGGSADAAGALVACDALWATHLDREELLELAADVGSDVPFSISGGTALGTGRGEQLAPVLARGTYFWVFAIADGGLSTPAVYAELDRLREEPAKLRVVPSPDAVLAALAAGDPVRLARALHNDLEPAALRLRPQLQRVFDAGADLAPLGTVLSGSGPTVAFLLRDEEHAVDFAAALSGAGACRTVRAASGPVPGARVIS